MNNLKYLLFSCTFLVYFLASCQSNNKQIKQDQTNNNSKSVETQEANTKYPPAFPGQTRINKVATKTPYEVKILSKDLKRPWAIIQMPDDRFLITEKSGKMKILGLDGSQQKEIKGLPKVDDDGQGGLLDVALDPDFISNRMIYWSFSEPHDEGNLTAVGKGRLSADETKLEDIKVIFRAFPVFDSDLHFGSRLAFDKDQNLFVSTGERSHMEGRMQAQNLKSGLGKYLKLPKKENRHRAIHLSTLKMLCLRSIHMEIEMHRGLIFIPSQENYGKRNLALEVVTRSISSDQAKIMDGRPLLMGLNIAAKLLVKPLLRKKVWNNLSTIGIRLFLRAVFHFMPHQ